MISVASGKVEGVETAKAEEPGVEEEEMSKDNSEKFEAIDSNIETLKAENESLKSANKELEGRIQTLESKFSESMDQVLDLVAEIAKGPSDEPTRKPKANAFSGHESKDAKAERFLNRFAK
jgi:predicted RNase H-like nuclease (RuvC/YqgF family)